MRQNKGNCFITGFLAGAGAGIGTGFAGMSAAAVIGPMLASFLGVPAYEAVGIGLISDVLASAVSAYTYKKSGNLDVKNSLPMMISVLIVTVIDSFVASFLPERAMGSTMQIALIILGLRFILKPVTTTREQMNAGSAKERLMKAIIGGIFVGFICGFVGAGGGMMMLDAVCTDFFSGISDAHGSWNQCIHHGIYRTYRRNQSFRNRWHARHYDYGPMRRIHTSLG